MREGEVLWELEKEKWVADSAKARLFMRRVEFCGHVLGGGKRTPAPGKLAAVQHWQVPTTVTALRAFLGLCNYYAGYVRMFADLAAPLMEKLKLTKELTKAGSKHRVEWTVEEVQAFEKLKQALVADLQLYHVEPSKPFALKTDASDYAIGAALEQFPKITGVPKLEEIKPGSSVAVAFMSRKLATGQRTRWDTRDKETYAVVSALEKWASYVGYNPVLVLTDHKILESWYKEHVSGLGPTGRRARWHTKLSKFNIDVVHIPGCDNFVGDALSRWGYPASAGNTDVSWHGTPEETEEMKKMLEDEREAEKTCPAAVHPSEGVAQTAVIREVKMFDGKMATVVDLPSGRRLGLAMVSFKRSAMMDRRIAAVTTRAQAKKQGQPQNAFQGNPPPMPSAPSQPPAPCVPSQPHAHTPSSLPSPSHIQPEPSSSHVPSPPAQFSSSTSPSHHATTPQPAQSASQTQSQVPSPDPPESVSPGSAPRAVSPSLSPHSPPSVTDTTSLHVHPATSTRHPPSPFDVDEYVNLLYHTAILQPSDLAVPVPPANAPSSHGAMPQATADHTSRSDMAPSADVQPSTPTGLVNPDDIFKVSWVQLYEKCPKWKDVWSQVQLAQRRQAPWPKGYRLCDQKLLKDGVWCVPTELTGVVLRAQHKAAGHVGGHRLWTEACRHYQFANPDEAWGLANKMQRICEICQACEHLHQPLKLKVYPTPVPDSIMTSVSIDLFVMPEVKYDGAMWNVFAACVDRHSGWIVATPHHTKGLTAEKVAKAMYQTWWSPHGLPSVITSDRGPHFAGAWWRTMCALHGVRHAYAQAHHHPGNGRAEVAGAQLHVRLRKLQASDGICWVEALPRAVQQLHDVPGQCGLSPYEVLYGRHRPYAGVPYDPPRRLEDAVAFFDRQRHVDTKVAQALNALHDVKAAQVNKSRRELDPLAVGTFVWYLRPRGRPGEKLETYWLGPCPVLQRVGDHSYVVELEPGRHQHAHRSQLKPHVADPIGPPVKLYQYRQAREDIAVGPSDWNVEKILGHRRGPNGDPMFEVLWEGSKQTTWEPLCNFFHRYNPMVIEYCVVKKLNVDLLKYLAAHPPDDDAMVAEVLAAQKRLGICWEEPPTEWMWDDSLESSEASLAIQGVTSPLGGPEMGH